MTNKGCFISIFFFLAVCLVACQESMEERAAREAYNYTRKFCPTPFVNCIRTDSVVFDGRTRTYLYYCTFGDVLDDSEVISANRQKVEDILRSSIRQSTTMKQYVEAGFHFRYICRSEKSPSVVLIQTAFWCEFSLTVCGCDNSVVNDTVSLFGHLFWHNDFAYRWNTRVYGIFFPAVCCSGIMAILLISAESTR